MFGTGATCIGGLANPLAGRFAFRDGGANGATPDGVINDCGLQHDQIIARLDTNVFNGPGVKTDGIDVSTQFDWDMAGGTATIGLNATYVLEIRHRVHDRLRQPGGRARSTPQASSTIRPRHSRCRS